jgi:hypothetical protein
LRRDEFPYFNEKDREIMRGVLETVKKWPPRRRIVTTKEYAERVRKGLPLGNIVTWEELRSKWGLR